MTSPQTCTVDGCDKPVRCKGMCVTHYYRSKDGRPLDGTQSKRDRVIEDAEWIAGTDHPDSIAIRCGFANTDTFYDALRRWGRQDLVDRCLRWWPTHATSKELAA